MSTCSLFFCFLFNDTATTEIYTYLHTRSLHDALPILLPSLTGDDLATILFTSGSTGQSKGAWSRHRAVVQAIFNYVTQTASIVHLLTEDGQMSDIQPATLICTTLSHVTAERPVFLPSCAFGRKLGRMPKWKTRQEVEMEN